MKAQYKKFLLFLLLVAITSLLSTFHWIQKDRVINVIEVKGNLFESSIKQSGDSMFPVVHFQYNYNGRVYESHRYSAFGGNTELSNREEIDQFEDLQRKDSILVYVPQNAPQDGYLDASDYGSYIGLLLFLHFAFLMGSLRKAKGFVTLTWMQFAFSSLLAIDWLVTSHDMIRPPVRWFILFVLGSFLLAAVTQYFFWKRVQQRIKKTRKSIA